MIRVQFDNYTALHENFRNVLNWIQIITAKHYMYESIVLFDWQYILKLKCDTVIYEHYVRGHY